MCKLNFNEITYLNPRLTYYYFLFWKQTALYCNCTSAFDIDLFIAIGMSFCVDLPNFCQTELRAAELWRHVDFSKMVAMESWIYFRLRV